METGQQPDSSVPNNLSVTILILNWNGRSLLQTCLPPLLHQTYANYHVVVVDNGSTDDSVAFVQENFPQVQLILNEENLGFSRGTNAGLRQISADVVVLLNNDVLVQPNWLAELIRPFHQDPHIGIVGCQLLYPDGTIQHLGAELTYPLAHSHHFHYKATAVPNLPAVQDVPYVTGAALAIRHTVQQAIGLLDETFHPFYYEEVDYCYRAKAAGFRVVLAAQATAVHNESASLNKVPGLKLQTLHRNRYLFVLKHYTPAQFLQDFVPAEQKQLAEQYAFLNVDAIRLACLEVAIVAPHIVPQERTSAEITAVQNALLQLRETAMKAQINQQAAPPNLTEFAFPASATPFGALVSKLRQAWSSIAAKWLVRHLQQQQAVQNDYFQQQIERLTIQTESQAAEIEQLLAALLPTQHAFHQLAADFSKRQQQLDQFSAEQKSSS